MTGRRVRRIGTSHSLLHLHSKTTEKPSTWRKWRKSRLRLAFPGLGRCSQQRSLPQWKRRRPKRQLASDLQPRLLCSKIPRPKSRPALLSAPMLGRQRLAASSRVAMLLRHTQTMERQTRFRDSLKMITKTNPTITGPTVTGMAMRQATTEATTGPPLPYLLMTPQEQHTGFKTAESPTFPHASG